MSKSNRCGLSSSACRRASGARLGGSSSSEGHRRAVDEHRNDAGVARQGGLDLEADEVLRVVEPATAVVVGDGQPLVPDQREQHVAGADGGRDPLHEVVARIDRVDVLEDLVLAEPRTQAVEEPARRVGGLLASIADEDSRHRATSGDPKVAPGAAGFNDARGP